MDDNEAEERVEFTEVVKSSVHLLKSHCSVFCGPALLIHSVLCLCYYSAITSGCHSLEDHSGNLIIYQIVIEGCVSVLTTMYCLYATMILCKAGKEVSKVVVNEEPALLAGHDAVDEDGPDIED